MDFKTKAELRGFIRGELKEKNEEELSKGSSLICDALRQNCKFVRARSVAFFLPLKTEVNLIPLIELCMKEKRDCFIPLVTDVEKCTMDFFKLDDKLSLSEQLKPGNFGILEPCIELPEMAADEVFMLVPGMGFDTSFNRVGKGKGFYDRFFEKYKGKITKAGICFDFQLLENVPADEHDIKMDLIFTDKRVLEFK